MRSIEMYATKQITNWQIVEEVIRTLGAGRITVMTHHIVVMSLAKLRLYSSAISLSACIARVSFETRILELLIHEISIYRS